MQVKAREYCPFCPKKNKSTMKNPILPKLLTIHLFKAKISYKRKKGNPKN